ncbi:MAG: glycoside hydrolase family 18 [Alistipes sp.]
MKIKRNIWALSVVLLFATAFANCSDWTEVEASKMVDYDNTVPARPASYYAALRSYKSTKHSLSFGWYSGWGNASVSTANMLTGLPDSMDMVSLWDNAMGLSQSKIEDLNYVQNVRGTKVLVCVFLQHVGKSFTPEEYNTDEKTREAFWGWVDGDEAAIKGSMDKYARAIMDTLTKYNYAGLDIDFEPHVDGVPGKLDENTTYVEWMFDILSKYLGPQSSSGKLLVVDGEITNIPTRTCVYFNYLIAQAYSVSGGTPSPSAGTDELSMDYRLGTVLNTFKGVQTEEELTNKFMVTENLESAIDALNGGYFWALRDGTKLKKEVCPSLLGMARWQPINGFLKGGFGGYRFDAEGANTPAYKWMRRAIQAANPALK